MHKTWKWVYEALLKETEQKLQCPPDCSFSIKSASEAMNNYRINMGFLKQLLTYHA